MLFSFCNHCHRGVKPVKNHSSVPYPEGFFPLPLYPHNFSVDQGRARQSRSDQGYPPGAGRVSPDSANVLVGITSPRFLNSLCSLLRDDDWLELRFSLLCMMRTSSLLCTNKNNTKQTPPNYLFSKCDHAFSFWETHVKVHFLVNSTMLPHFDQSTVPSQGMSFNLFSVRSMPLESFTNNEQSAQKYVPSDAGHCVRKN